MNSRRATNKLRIENSQPGVLFGATKALSICASVLVCTGCQQLGALMYISGATPPQKVAAEYKLPSGPVLILVDDEQDLVQPAITREMLVDSLAKQLRNTSLPTESRRTRNCRACGRSIPSLTSGELGKSAGRSAPTPSCG